MKSKARRRMGRKAKWTSARQMKLAKTPRVSAEFEALGRLNGLHEQALAMNAAGLR
jgi:hypothetical protein